MGFSLILAGFLFLVVPTVNIVDLMPDFIGYFLIFAGLSKLKYIDSYMKKASGYAMIMALVNLTKPLALALCTSVESADASASNITTATLIYLVIELIYGINLIRALFSGFTNLGYQFENSTTKSKLVGRFLFKRKPLAYGDSVQNPQSPARKRIFPENTVPRPVVYVSLPRRKAIFTGVDALYVFTLVFFVIRCAFTLLPELTTLAYTLTSRGTYEQIPNTATRLMLIAFCFVVGLILGISWYLSLRKYIRSVSRDLPFTERIAEAYRVKVTDNSDVMRSIKYSGIEKLIFPAIILGGDVFIDRTDIFPDLLSAVLLIFCFFALKNVLFPKKLCFVMTGAYLATSAVALLCQSLAFGSYYAETGAQAPLSVEVFTVIFPVMKGLFALLLVLLLVSQLRFIKENFQRAPIYSKGRLTVGTVFMVAAQIGSAVGYFTDIISEDLIHFPVKLGTMIWDANVYVSFGSFVVYAVGAVVFLGGIDHVAARLAGKD